MVRGAGSSARHAHGFESGFRSRESRRLVETNVHQAKRDILQNRRHKELVIGILKDHSNLSADLRNIRRTDGQSANLNRPLSGKQSVQVQDKSRFSTSVRAE